MRQPSVAGILVAAACMSGPAAAQTEVSPVRSYALTNVRVVVSPGRVIDRGTVLIRDGRIVAAGANVQVPPGVVSLDLTGKTVYPGLIDAATTMGLPAPPQGGGRGGGRGGAPDGEDSGPPYEVDSGREAADVFRPDGDDLDGLRAAGITTAGLAFTGGIFPGRVSAIDAKDGPARSAVIRTPVAQQVALGRKRGAYPSTLMGALAYIKQSFADTRYDARVTAAFQRSPGTTPLPEYDAEHVGLQPAAAGTLPVWLAATSPWDIERVIDLAKEIGVTDYAILGGQEAYQVSARVKAAGKPVIVSVDFPNPTGATGRVWEQHVAPVSGPDREKEQLDTAAAKALRGNAAALVRAGVPIALASFGTSGPAQFRERLITLVAEGLPADEALRATTVTPAQLLGLSGAMGTIEAGKWANLVVSEGDLFTKDAKIRHVFVEGERYDIREAPARTEGGGRGGRGGGPGGAAMAAGTWTGTLDAQGTTLGFTLTISGSGSELTGSLGTEMGTTALRGSQQGGEVRLSGTADMNGQPLPLSITATVEGDRLTGSIEASGMGTFPLNARRGPGDATDRTDGGER